MREKKESYTWRWRWPIDSGSSRSIQCMSCCLFKLKKSNTTPALAAQHQSSPPGIVLVLPISHSQLGPMEYVSMLSANVHIKSSALQNRTRNRLLIYCTSKRGKSLSTQHAMFSLSVQCSSGNTAGVTPKCLLCMQVSGRD